MPRLLLVSYHFPPSDAVGARRPARFATRLVAHGYSVDVVCSSVLSRTKSPHDDPIGIGFADLTQQYSPPDAVRVFRTETPFLWNRYPLSAPPRGRPVQSFFWRVKTYAEWFTRTVDWSWRWAMKALERLLETQSLSHYDIVLVDGPPRPAMLPFVLAARAARIPVVADLRDLWLPWFPGGSRLLSILLPQRRREYWRAQLCRELVANTDLVLLTSREAADSMRSTFREKESDFFQVVHNAFESDSVDSDRTELYGEPTGPMRIVYTGSLSYGRDRIVATLIQAIGISLRAGNGPRVELTLAGARKGSLPDVAAAAGASDSVKFLPWLDREGAIALQRQADALLLLQTVEPLDTWVAIPGKLFEYMARRKPILSLATPASNRIVEEHNLGEVADQSSPERIAEALHRLDSRRRKTPQLPPPPHKYSDVASVEVLARALGDLLKPGTITP